MTTKCTSRGVLSAALVAGVLHTAGASAAPRQHDGFYVNLNAGVGYVSASAEEAGLENVKKGFSLPMGVLFGVSVIPGLVVGGNLFWHVVPSLSESTNGVDHTPSGTAMHLVGIGPFVDFYPDPSKGLHFQGMVGWSELMPPSESAHPRPGENPTGLVMQLGAGYDFWVGDEWSIGPVARFAYAPLGNDDVSVPTIAPSIAASFTYH